MIKAICPNCHNNIGIQLWNEEFTQIQEDGYNNWVESFVRANARDIADKALAEVFEKKEAGG